MALAFRVASAGHVITGFVLSTTLTLMVLLHVPPLPSSALTITLLAPRLRVVGLTMIVSTSPSGSVTPVTSLPEMVAWHEALAFWSAIAAPLQSGLLLAGPCPCQTPTFLPVGSLPPYLRQVARRTIPTIAWRYETMAGLDERALKRVGGPAWDKIRPQLNRINSALLSVSPAASGALSTLSFQR